MAQNDVHEKIAEFLTPPPFPLLGYFRNPTPQSLQKLVEEAPQDAALVEAVMQRDPSRVATCKLVTPGPQNPIFQLWTGDEWAVKDFWAVMADAPESAQEKPPYNTRAVRPVDDVLWVGRTSTLVRDLNRIQNPHGSVLSPTFTWNTEDPHREMCLARTMLERVDTYLLRDAAPEEEMPLYVRSVLRKHPQPTRDWGSVPEFRFGPLEDGGGVQTSLGRHFDMASHWRKPFYQWNPLSFLRSHDLVRAWVHLLRMPIPNTQRRLWAWSSLLATTVAQCSGAASRWPDLPRARWEGPFADYAAVLRAASVALRNFRTDTWQDALLRQALFTTLDLLSWHP